MEKFSKHFIIHKVGEIWGYFERSEVCSWLCCSLVMTERGESGEESLQPVVTSSTFADVFTWSVTWGGELPSEVPSVLQSEGGGSHLSVGRGECGDHLTVWPVAILCLLLSTAQSTPDYQSTSVNTTNSHSQQHLAVEISGGQRWALIQYTTYNNLFCYQLLESYYSQIVLQDIKEGFSVCVSSNPINIQPIFAYDWRVWCRVMSRGWRRWPAQTATSQWRRWSVWRKPSRSLTGTGTVRSALRSSAR